MNKEADTLTKRLMIAVVFTVIICSIYAIVVILNILRAWG